LALSFVTASFGLDGSNVIRRGDLAALHAFVAAAEREPARTPALLVLGPGDLPSSPPRSDATHRYVTRTDLVLPVGLQPSLRASAMVEALTLALVNFTGQDINRAALYAVWSPVTQFYAVEYGLAPPAELPTLRAAFLASGYWRIVLVQDGTYLFRFDPATYRSVTA
ncbi:MAG: hypothetical protein ABIO67_07455, partial [Mycobacteriales bacterium]